MSKLAFLDIETNVFICGEKSPNGESNMGLQLVSWKNKINLKKINSSKAKVSDCDVIIVCCFYQIFITIPSSFCHLAPLCNTFFPLLHLR